MSPHPPSNKGSPKPEEDELAGPTSGEATTQPDPVRSRFDKGIVWCGRGAAWLIFIAMAISVFEVIMRYGFDSPTSWVHESVVMLVAVSFSLGGPVALASNRHIRVRVLYDTVGPRFKLWLDRFNDLVTLGFCVGMSYAPMSCSGTLPTTRWASGRWNAPAPTGIRLFQRWSRV